MKTSFFFSTAQSTELHANKMRLQLQASRPHMAHAHRHLPFIPCILKFPMQKKVTSHPGDAPCSTNVPKSRRQHDGGAATLLHSTHLPGRIRALLFKKRPLRALSGCKDQIMLTSRAPSLAATATAVLCALAAAAALARAQQCGSQAGGATCQDCLCCSRFGFCGSTAEYCGAGCQSQCTGCGPAGPGVGAVVPRDLFERLLLHRNDAACPARGFYTYDAFVAAAAAFPAFAATGDAEVRKREVAAFLGQTSHETTGGWPTAPDGPFSWGYCFKQERNPPSDYCEPRPQWPCAPGKKYFGRGPIQLSFNYNYGPAGRAIGVDLLNNPDLVATDPVVSFKTALWFWMTARDNKPSCHAVITGRWAPTAADMAAGRAPGYGVITNVINGGLECGRGPDPRVADRVGFYKRYCDVFGIGYGSNLDCDRQRPFNSGESAALAAQ